MSQRHYEDTILAGLRMERTILTGGMTMRGDGSDDLEQIDRYGRRMLRYAERNKIKPTDSDEQIAKSISAGLLAWLFWQIAPDLLLWIVSAIRKRIWESQNLGSGS
jgi:hypothetical protein